MPTFSQRVFFLLFKCSKTGNLIQSHSKEGSGKMKSKVIYVFHIILVVMLAWGLGYSVARGQVGMPPAPQAPQVAATAFTYQGSLKQAGSAVNSTCDFKFGLWNAQSLGTQVGLTQTLTSTVSGGLFSVKLNGSSQFGATPFDGSSRWLATAVRCPAGSGSYTSLTPQELNAAPYALSAPWSGISGKPSNTLVVAKSGGDFNTITAALSSISDASEANRYLVKVMPGVYTETVTMKQYVDIEGSGELTTKITYTGNVAILGTLRGANNAEMRFLTVESTGGGGAAYAVAISNYSTSPRLTHITATASGAADNLGVYNDTSSIVMTNVTAKASGGTNSQGVFNVFSSPVMTNVSASGTGGTFARGVYISASSTVMTNVTASASGGTSVNIGVDISASSSLTMTNVIASASDGPNTKALNITASSLVIQNSTLRALGGTNNYGIYTSATSGTFKVKINNSQVAGSTNTIFNDSHFTTRVGATLLDGGAVSNAGTLTCAGVYDENYVFSASTCP
jgi:pectin methylesterase-like acyl-CoA thioesterase